MNWNHRVVRRDDGELEICEVFFDLNTNKFYGYTSSFLISKDLKGLSKIIDQMRDCLNYPIIDSSVFEFLNEDDEEDEL